ncbi:MAG: DUF1015 family protein [Acidobacteria bacterium]|nr:DUF1015 family protein [Acidobacteriota bacterium]MCA1611376.1 DUF1015 family protein [Acidobacteriota bacterium]
MATLHPFFALRPSPQSAARVSAVPYDVVNTEEARRLADGNPLSFLHVSRPEIDLPADTDPHADAVYRKAAENFEILKRDAPLVSEGEASLYTYRLSVNGHEQTGIAGCCSMDEYDSDVIRKHERTRRDKEDDRTRHMIALKAQTGPVFLTYRDVPSAGALVEESKRDSPLYDFQSEDGVRHTLWRMRQDPGRALVQAFGDVPRLYIADGHHRAASASRARAHFRSLNPADRAGLNEFDYFLTVLFPASQVRILPYNRIVRDLNDLSPEELLRKVGKKFTVVENAPAEPARRGEFAIYLAGRWYGLVPREANSDTLDATVLQDEVLSPILGVRDIRTDKRIDFVGGGRGTAELQRLVDSGAAAAAFSLYPVSLEQLMAVSDANEIMPPKSTWFEPKLRDGLLVHQI